MNKDEIFEKRFLSRDHLTLDNLRLNFMRRFKDAIRSASMGMYGDAHRDYLDIFVDINERLKRLEGVGDLIKKEPVSPRVFYILEVENDEFVEDLIVFCDRETAMEHHKTISGKFPLSTLYKCNGDVYVREK
jgi:hypothetical protein